LLLEDVEADKKSEFEGNEILSTSGMVNDLVYQNRSTLIDADHADYL
jgi:hypothetical protein